MNIPRLLFRLLLGRRLPITKGELKIHGINKPVVIRRDHYGVPYIEAENDDDAWYGLGFCHGQDRAFQLEALFRVVCGTLAELIGPAVLPIDQLSRRIGFYHASKQQLEHLDDDVHQMLNAYTRGTFDGANIGCKRKAHEFTLLRTQPSRYDAAGVLGILKLMSFTLATNWDVELARLKVLNEDGLEALKALDPTYPEWLYVTSPPTGIAGDSIDRVTEDMALFTKTVGHGGGSNNWVIAPFCTATGRPILANDPHQAPVLPPHYYLAHIRTPDWAIAGATFVGGPVFVAGHNGTVSWGMTAGMIDNTDLFIEEVGPNGKSIREGDEFVDCEVREEIIHVKGSKPVTEEVLTSPRGPIISPALEGDLGAISIQATWLKPKSIRGLFQLHRVQTFEEFQKVFEQWPSMSLNMVYADTSGTVGWQLVGEAPQRRKGWGTLPLAGWDKEAGWEDDPVPFSEMPCLKNPEIGFVATANAKPACDGKSPFLGIDWVDGYRMTSIVEALNARNDWDLESTQALQLDQMSIPWRELKDIILDIPAQYDEVIQAHFLLRAWDGILSADSSAASIFELFINEMNHRIIKAKAPNALRWVLGKGCTQLMPFSILSVRHVGHLVRLIRKQPDGWFVRSWDKEIADALKNVILTLKKIYGKDSKSWAWGQIRTLTLRHFIGERSPFNYIFNLGPIQCGGDANTIAQASVNPLDPEGNPLFIACLRMVIDVGNWEESRFALPGGQAGNPLSPHYDDQLSLWQNGKGVPISWSSKKIKERTETTLILNPVIKAGAQKL